MPALITLDCMPVKLGHPAPTRVCSGKGSRRAWGTLKACAAAWAAPKACVSSALRRAASLTSHVASWYSCLSAGSSSASRSAGGSRQAAGAVCILHEHQHYAGSTSRQQLLHRVHIPLCTVSSALLGKSSASASNVYGAEHAIHQWCLLCMPALMLSMLLTAGPNKYWHRSGRATHLPAAPSACPPCQRSWRPRQGQPPGAPACCALGRTAPSASPLGAAAPVVCQVQTFSVGT